MPETVVLQASPRESAKAKALRREGWVPGVIYGRGSEATSLQFTQAQLERAVLHAGTNRLLTLSITGEEGTQMALFRDVQRDPVSRAILHVDLYSVVAGQVITSTVPVVLVGEAPVTQEGMSVSQLVSELDIECMPQDLPNAIHVDVSVLVDENSAIAFSDLDIPLGVTVLNPPDGDIVRVYVPRAVEEEEEVEEPILGYGEAASESDAADAAEGAEAE
ncbi:MAG: 50S ribosomal protein L25 [Chloroflexi bacterium]|jgi:large subunit ribosomal protein L25|nr:50S ribosomal protein L25 [Chloroflexota bacterium]